LTTKEAKKKIEFLADNGSGTIAFTGGEPTIRNDLLELIEYVKDVGVQKVELQTNGVKLEDKNYVKKLEEVGLDFILLAIHSHLPEKYDLLTQTKENFNKIIKCLENLNDSKIEVSISHVINKENYKSLVKFVKFIKERALKINYFYFGFVRPNGRTLENKWLVPKLSEIEKYLYESFEYCKKKGINFNVEGIPLCYMKGFENHNDEIKRVKNGSFIHIERNEVREDTHRRHLLEDKMKGKQCKFCRVNKVCPGVWKEYAEIFGTDELFPVFEEVDLDG